MRSRGQQTTQDDQKPHKKGSTGSCCCSVVSHVWLFLTPWTAACQASLSFTLSPSLLKLMSIEAVMPSSHLILCHPILLPPSIFPSIRVFSNESALHIRWPKYWSFSFSISPSNAYSGLIHGDGETVSDFFFFGSKITADGDCSQEIKRRLLLGRKVMTNLDSILNSRDIILPTEVRLVKAMVFPVVMYGCESWKEKEKLSAEKLMLLNCGVGEDSWESLGLQGDPTSPS